MKAPLVVALGQTLAGDDGVGLAVLAALRQRPELPVCELLGVADPSRLLELLERGRAIIVIDALVGVEAGSVVTLDRAALERRGAARSHGIDVLLAIELHESLDPERTALDVTFVGVGIARPRSLGIGLSPAVAAAVTRAAERVISLLRELERDRRWSTRARALR